MKYKYYSPNANFLIILRSGFLHTNAYLTKECYFTLISIILFTVIQFILSKSKFEITITVTNNKYYE